MTLAEKLLNLPNLGKTLIETQSTTLLDDGEARVRKLADELATKIHRSLLTAASIIAGALVILAVVQLVR